MNSFHKSFSIEILLYLNKMMRFPSAAFSKIFTNPPVAAVPSMQTTTTDMNMTTTEIESKWLDKIHSEKNLMISTHLAMHPLTQPPRKQTKENNIVNKSLLSWLNDNDWNLHYFNATNKCVKHADCTHDARD